MVGFRQILVILGVILLIRLIGKVMSARRNINAQDQHFRNQKNADFEREKARQNFGKTTIKKVNKENLKDSDYTEYEEVE